jgi:hypothetical protein
MSSPESQTPYQPWREERHPRPADLDGQASPPERLASPIYPPPPVPYVLPPVTEPHGFPKPKIGMARVVRRAVAAALIFGVLIVVGVAFRGNRLPFVHDLVDRLVGADDPTTSAGDPPSRVATSSAEPRAGLCLEDALGKRRVYQMLPLVDCSQKHGGEVVGTFKMPKGKYPGESSILRKVNEKCPEQILAWAPNLAGKNVVFGFVGPTAAQWKLGNRVVACIVVDRGGDAVGSIKD